MDRPNSVLLGFLIEGNQRTIYFHYLMNKMKKKRHWNLRLLTEISKWTIRQVEAPSWLLRMDRKVATVFVCLLRIESNY